MHRGFQVLLALLCPTASIYAQILYGSIVGNVKDPSEAAVAGAAVTVTNKETSQTRQTTTNESGGYNFPTLLPGTYDLTVTREGFRTFSQRDVQVTINSVTRVDVTLQLGAVAETVTITAEAASLQTDRSEVRAEVTSKIFQNLPVSVGRNYQQLLRTLPGFRPPTNAHSVPTNPSRALTFNVNGVSQSINNTRIDGASNIAPWLPHITSFVPTLEAIETVNAVTNSFDAEQGLAGGAAINVQIKSGTNDLHGSAFEYHTDQRLKARPFFLPADRDKPKLVNNEFGGTLGGPIRKNKLFYFMSYEGTPNRENASRFGTVPTAAMKRGDMSESPRPIFDPLTGNPDGSKRIEFPGKIIPASRISPISQKLASLTPLPNQPGLSDNYFASGSYLFDRHRADTKLNWNATDKLTTFARFSLLHYDMSDPEMFGAVGGPEISAAGGNPGTGFGNTYSLTTAATYLFAPNFIADAYFGWTRMDTAVEQSRLDEKLGLDFLGIPGTNGPRRFEGGWPRFSISSFTNIGIDNAFMPYNRSDPQYQYVANFNWTRNTHELRFGLDFYKTGMNHLQPEATGALHGASGGFTFGGGPTTTVGGPSANQFNSYATFLLGLPTAIGKITQVPNIYTTRQWNYSLYARDRWNATRKLTLSYGLRWEYFPFPTRADRGMEWYDGARNKMLVCGIGEAPKDCGVHVSKRLFAPRFGVAWRPKETFVIRAGYGITNDPYSLQRPLRTNYPVLLIQNITAPNSFQFAGLLKDGIPPAQAPDLGNGVIDIPGTFAVVTTPKDFKRAYIQSWNLTLQKQLKWGFTGQAGYVATRTTREMAYIDVNAGQIIGAGRAGQPLNQKFKRTAATTLVTPIGSTRYDSLQTMLERRFGQGFQMAAAYTWSKVIGFVDNNDSEPSVRALAFLGRNRVVRGYDRPHNFQLTSIYELPFGSGKKWVRSGPIAHLAGGWQLNNVLSLFSGTPFSVDSDGTSLNMPGSDQSADQIKKDVKKLGGIGKGKPFFDPSAFAPVREPRFGNTGLNILRGPGVVNWDFSVFRRFNLSERYKLEFRMESFNFTNTPHFSNPGRNVSAFNPEITDPLRRFGGFTEITSVANALGRDGFDERQFRFGLRVSF